MGVFVFINTCMRTRKYEYATFTYIGEIKLPVAVAEKCSHSGDCHNDVIECLKLPYVRTQLGKIDRDKLRKELEECGAWDAEQLQNHNDNLERILWIASGDIVENKKTR
jgi:hypothetical protein